jgi:Putative Ig domain
MKIPKGIFLLLVLCWAQTCDARPRGGGPIATSIGGITIGTQGTSGFYSGYTLAGGDDFSGPLDIVNVTSPNAPYFPTIAYGAGARGTTSQLADSYDSDPYNSGSQDANRGVALGSTNMSQAASILTLQARIENTVETGNIGRGRTLVDAMIDSSGYLSVSPPAIIEARVNYGIAPPSGDHPTFWITSDSPVTGLNGLEFDWEANTYDGGAPTGVQNNYNVHGTVSGWSSGHGNNASLYDGNFHIIAFVLTTLSIQYYADGSLITSISGNTAITQRPYYILLTHHIINPTSFTAWDTLGQTGISFQIDWYRVWIPNSQFPSGVILPRQNLPNIQVAYNSSMTYTIPPASTLWGAGISDYCQGRKFEDYEPGSNVAFSGNYSQWPAGLTWNSSTRVLTGITTDAQPGRIHTICTPAYVSGGSLGYKARGYIDVGPTVSASNISYSNGTGSYDLYPITPTGTLVPKTVSVSGLPSGLSFNPSTFLITGTATTGSYTISVSVTNSSGQNAISDVRLNVGS